MKMRRLRFLFYIIVVILPVFLVRCANIVPPDGGPKDTIPPVLVKAIPPDSSLHFHSRLITLNFDEYIQLQGLTDQLVYTPTSLRQPQIISKFRTLTIQLNDTLKPNTTYTLNFGNAIRDLDEGNPINDFRYIFSTGSYLDSLSISGKVDYAQTGLPDSNIVIMLYQDLSDSVVSKQKPVYYTRSDGKGHFKLENLPHGEFKLFALKDQSNALAYIDSTEFIAFINNPIQLNRDTAGVHLYLFAESSAPAKNSGPPNLLTPPSGRLVKKKQLRWIGVNPRVGSGGLDITGPLIISLDQQVRTLDTSKLHLQEDTSYTPVNALVSLDSTGTLVSVTKKWDEDMLYRLVLDSGFVKDSSGVYNRQDTIDFRTKSSSDYGSIILRFKNLDSLKHYVVQIVSNNLIKYTGPLLGNIWRKDMVEPGTYEIRVLVDRNNNGIWDNGRYYGGKKQPEHVIAIPQQIEIRESWENRMNVSL